MERERQREREREIEIDIKRECVCVFGHTSGLTPHDTTDRTTHSLLYEHKHVHI